MRQLTISGNVGSDPKLKDLSNGQVANFDIAVRQTRPVNGQYGVDWIRCAVFGKRADVIMNYVHKGSHMAVSGTLEINQWQRDDGTQSTQIGINVSDFDLPDNNRDSQQNDTHTVSDGDLPF